MREYHVVSFSGGKDSTAMLLHMLELGMPVDEIIFCDTGVEFPQMYEHVDKVERYIGRKITRLKSDKSFEYFLLQHKVKARAPEAHTDGYSFPFMRGRWCTGLLKEDLLNKNKKRLSEKYDVRQYVGIAVDEPNRIKTMNYPLVEWGWTEEKCLQYCYEKGFDWGGLYQIFKRVSCWCCPLQSLQELRQLRKHFPELWAQLMDWQHQTWRKFRPDYSVDELEARFAMEDEQEKAQILLFTGV